MSPRPPGVGARHRGERAAVLGASPPRRLARRGDYTATAAVGGGHTGRQGGSSGAFTYSYPIEVPPVPGGLEPDVTLAYNSQAVDGLTSSTNDQASWIGDGWDYCARLHRAGLRRPAQNKPPDAPLRSDDGWVKSGDLCWSANNVTTLSLNGINTTLVSGGLGGRTTWHAESRTGTSRSSTRPAPPTAPTTATTG